ncbi:hypothetical protein X797_010263 [Metarhizium robertsii]|uniref:Uncharacterized protein n=1 Tax=Metarhizium robertsii TaxID=568076 RepID=A0A014PKR2_9HYPO|nr:hypothetical protein X797_010263 [Metarhizium robertsii]
MYSAPTLLAYRFTWHQRNATKSLVAFLQLCYSIFVLIRAEGNQVDLYGAAAFSLTVAPYAVMAAVNLLANALVPQYDCLFLVENDVMQEIRSQHNLQFHGIVGKVLQTEKGEPVTLHLPGEEDGGQKWVSGIPGFQQDARLRLLTPDEAISDGVLPDIFVTISASHEIEREANINSTLFFGFLPVVIIMAISRFRRPIEDVDTQRVVQMMWTGIQQCLGIMIANQVFLAQGKAAVPAPILRKFWSNNNRLLTPESFRRLGFHNRVYGSLHHRMIRLLYRIWIHANTLPLSLLTLLRYPFASGNSFSTTLFFAFFVPAVWGLVLVGRMLKEYGNCVRVY